MRSLRTLPAIRIIPQSACVGNTVLRTYGVTLRDALGTRRYLFETREELVSFLKGVGY